MLRAMSKVILLCSVLASTLLAQDSDGGISLPLTLSAGAMYTQRLQLENPSDSPFTAGARVSLYPTIKLGAHWFGYAAIDARLTPYLYYDAYDSDHQVYTNVIQALVGYSIRTEKTSVVIKAGKLASAFGSFPLRYDDAENPLLDQPLSYIQTLTLDYGQLPCGVKDLVSQYYGNVTNSCGGSGSGPGLTPVTLYGLPGAQVEFSGYRLDARLQITDGSPGFPEPLSRAGEYAQWTAGAGYTIHQGFRVGFSAFRGPYLEPSLIGFLPAGTNLRNFPASAIGLDAQWARGRWSATGEWQRFQYDLPNFIVAPSVVSTYGELKAVITPRLFIAGRAGWMLPGGAADRTGASSAQFAPYVASYELGAGSWINRHQLLKASYEWLHIQNFPGRRLDVLGVQFVTTFHAYDRAFHQ
jgi:hypothetical protein